MEARCESPPATALCVAAISSSAATPSLDGTAPELDRKIIGVATYIIATEPLGAERAQALIANNMAVSDMNWVLDYFRRSADHRLLFGGRVSYSGFDPARYGKSHARAHAQGVSAARRRQD